MNLVLRCALPVFGFAVCVGVFFLGLSMIESRLLPGLVVPPHGGELPDWLDAYNATELMWMLIPTLAISAIWTLVSIVSPGYRGDQRFVWCVLWALAVVISLIGAAYAGPREENGIGLYPTAFTLMNAALLFWIATAPFSIITHKFAPIGSLTARKFW